MADLDGQVLRAMAHTRLLAETIGPRPAGSSAESAGLEYARAALTRAGLAARLLPVCFTPLPPFFLTYPLAGAALAAVSLVWVSLPGLGLLMPLVTLLLPDLARLEGRARRPSASSSNVYAQITPQPNLPLLIFCAHVDSARAGPFDAPLLRRLYARALFLLQRSALILAALSLLRLAGLSIPVPIQILVSAAGLLAGLWFAGSDLAASLAHRGRWSPGANDNAAGVGVLLALAETLAAQPPPGLRVGFLVTGAEETGLHGAAHFASSPDFPPGPVSVVNLDMVGAGGQLHFVNREGGLFQIATDPSLNQLLQQANPSITPIRYVVKSGDHAAFIRRGIPAVSLQASGSTLSESAYHTVSDRMELVEPAALRRVLETLANLLEIHARPIPE